MIIDCIADLHGNYPDLKGGDVLIIAGDCLGNGGTSDQLTFLSWIQNCKYSKKIFIAGNHDNWLERLKHDHFSHWGFEYLIDSGTEISLHPQISQMKEGEAYPRDKIKIWGSPWTPWFDGVHPKCKSFMKKDSALKKHWDMIPADTDILITHGPPHNILDKNRCNEHCGSKTLFERVTEVKPKLHIFGHIHEAYGSLTLPRHIDQRILSFINCSYVDEDYRVINAPIRLEIGNFLNYNILSSLPNANRGSEWKCEHQ